MGTETREEKGAKDEAPSAEEKEKVEVEKEDHKEVEEETKLARDAGKEAVLTFVEPDGSGKTREGDLLEKEKEGKSEEKKEEGRQGKATVLVEVEPGKTRGDELVEERDEASKEGSKEETREEDEDSGSEGEEKDGEHKANEKTPKRRRRSKKDMDVVAPSTDRPTRERKKVERYSLPTPPSRTSSKHLSIEKGRGKQLKDIPNVVFKLSKRKPDDNLHLLHTILFGKKAKAQMLKKNISQFSGFVWTGKEEKQRIKVKEKLDKCVKEKLMDFCSVLDIPVNKSNVKKEELTGKLMEFLESPQVMTDVSLADQAQEGKKRKVIPSKRVIVSEASDVPTKRRKTLEERKKVRRSSDVEEEGKVPVKAESLESDDSHERIDDAQKMDVDNEVTTESEEEREEEKAKKQRMEKGSTKKTRTEGLGMKSKEKAKNARKEVPVKPIKGSARKAFKEQGSSFDGASTSTPKSAAAPVSRKQKVEKDNQKDKKSVPSKDLDKKNRQSNKSDAKLLAKEQGKGKTTKKGKTEPTRKEMHEVVVEILKEVDFNTATLSDILRQLGAHFNVDLLHRKQEVKDIITEAINNMSDDEDSEDEENDEKDRDK